MKRLGLCTLMLLTAAAPAVPVGPVALTSQPGSRLDATARKVAAADLAEAGRGALVLLGSQPLGTAGTGPALFVQVQSDRSCGSAGCSTTVYLPGNAGWTKVLDANGAVVVQATVHAGMHDLLVGKGDRWVWNGRTYADTLPAPQVDLRPRNRPTRTQPTRTGSPARP